MSVLDLINRAAAMTAITPENWRAFRDDLNAEYDATTNERDIETMLAIHKAMTGQMERHFAETGDQERLEAIRTVSKQDYNRLVLSKCMVGEEMSYQMARMVVEREVRAGRMTIDDEVYALVQSSASMNLPSHAELVEAVAKRQAQASAPQGVIGKLFGWFKGRA